MVEGSVVEDEGGHAGAFADVGVGVGAGLFGEEGDAGFDGVVFVAGPLAGFGGFGGAGFGGGFFAVVVFDALVLLFFGEGGVEVGVEVGIGAGGPGEGPAHAFFVGEEFGEWGAGDAGEGDVVVGEVGDEVVEAVGDGGAGDAAGGVVGAEHEMVDEELGATLEEIGECGGAGVGFEVVGFFDFYPGELLAFLGEFVAAAGEIFVFLEEGEAGGEPFFVGGGGVVDFFGVGFVVMGRSFLSGTIGTHHGVARVVGGHNCCSPTGAGRLNGVRIRRRWGRSWRGLWRR